MQSKSLTERAIEAYNHVPETIGDWVWIGGILGTAAIVILTTLVTLAI